MISLEEFLDHFASIADEFQSARNDDADLFCNTHAFNDTDCSFPELDAPITVQEVTTVISKLKRSKSCGSDCLLNEYFLECSDILSLHICDLFNAILDSGFFPESWSEGVIIPLHKSKH